MKRITAERIKRIESWVDWHEMRIWNGDNDDPEGLDKIKAWRKKIKMLKEKRNGNNNQ